jgi:hypothetical protein
VISPYAKAGYVDHQQLSHDAYLRFIENDFLGGARLNPATDGRPDPRPDVREEAPGLGGLAEDFNFNQSPRPPLILPTHPAPGPASCPPGYVPPGGPSSPLLACPSPRAPSAPTAIVPRLQLTASVARRQDLRLHHGRVYLMVGCNIACSIYAHGHLNLTRHHRHLGLRSKRATLPANKTVRIALSLSRSNLAAVRRALRRHHSVKAAIAVDATTDGQRQRYDVNVTLTWR